MMKTRASPQRPGLMASLLIGLIAWNLIPAPGRAEPMEPARTVSRTLHGDITTLSSQAAGMFDPARIWTFPIHFEHPMTVTTPEQLAQVKERITRHREPQYSAWLDLQKRAAAALTFDADPPRQMDIQGGYEEGTNLESMRDVLWSSASSAYTCSLMWRLSGEAKYAAKAAEILNAWTKTDTVFEGKDRGLQLGSHFTPMLYTVDLLHGYSGWSQAERHAFEAFWRCRVLVHTQFVMFRENNWGDNAMLGVMAAGIAFQDEFLVRRCLYRLNDYFYGNWKIRKDNRGTYLPFEVERNQGRSGLTYTGYAMQSITQLLEMARNFGPEFDWWHRRTTMDASLQTLVEDYYRWNVLHAPFPWYDENFQTGHPDYELSRANILETAHSRFPDLDPRIGEWLQAHRPVNGTTADLYNTLLKGRL